jgi:hypothetical protein
MRIPASEGYRRPAGVGEAPGEGQAAWNGGENRAFGSRPVKVLGLRAALLTG